MCTPGQQTATAFSQLSRDTLCSRSTPAESQTKLIFKNIVNGYSDKPIDTFLTIPVIASDDIQLQSDLKFQKAVDSPKFRKFAATHPEQRISAELKIAIKDKFPNLETHYKKLHDYMLGKIKARLSFQLAEKIVREVVKMMYDSAYALLELSNNRTELAEWKTRIEILLNSTNESKKDIGQQLLEGLGMSSASDLQSLDTMASSILAMSQKLTKEADYLRVPIPQNIFKTITRYPGAYDGMLKTLGAQPGSYTAQCTKDAIEEGKSQIFFEKIFISVLGVTTGLVISAMSLGAGIPAAATIIGATAGATMGAPGLLIAIQDVDKARMGEASGTMGDQAIENALFGRNLTAVLFVAGLIIPDGAGPLVARTIPKLSDTGASTSIAIIIDAIGYYSPSDIDNEAILDLHKKLKALSASKKQALSDEFDATLEAKGIPINARIAIIAAFAQENPSSLSKTPTKAALDLATYCDSLERE
ncbi:hypothetical protein ACMXYN_16000 [Neptuniibacter sp. PT8_73]|uniref:hypothetical protein n=1 Tax=Neptuniibacter sp. PT8_73 TaxID=3398206 RepID=UPI0039F517A3